MRSPTTTETLTRTPCWSFFDADGTLLRLSTMFDFEAHWIRTSASRAFEQDRGVDPERAIEAMYAERDSLPRREANLAFYRRFRGRRRADVLEAVDDWVVARSLSNGRPLIEPAHRALEQLRGRGIEPVLVSGSAEELLAPFARQLRIEHVLCTRLELHDGVYTGRILDAPTIGAGKRDRIQTFLDLHGGEGNDCHAFGDHHSDLAMLELVGHPHAVDPDPQLHSVALERGWPIVAAPDSLEHGDRS